MAEGTCPLTLRPDKQPGWQWPGSPSGHLPCLFPDYFISFCNPPPEAQPGLPPACSWAYYFAPKARQSTAPYSRNAGCGRPEPMMKRAISALGHQQASGRWLQGTHYIVINISLDKCFLSHLERFLFASRCWNSFRKPCGLTLESWGGSS